MCAATLRNKNGDLEHLKLIQGVIDFSSPGKGSRHVKYVPYSFGNAADVNYFYFSELVGGEKIHVEEKGGHK